MPISKISLRAGKPDAYRKAVLDSLYRALQDALDVPDGDEFMVLAEHNPVNFRYGGYLGIDRSDDLIYIQVTVFNTRTADQKNALYRCIAQFLGESPGVRPEDIFVTVLEAARENWSLGHGRAQFA
ncbi:MAG: tautomerase family protein [Pseudomonadota bacterium]